MCNSWQHFLSFHLITVLKKMSSGCVMACSGRVHLRCKWGLILQMRCDPDVSDLCCNKTRHHGDLLAPSPPSACVRLCYLQKHRQLLTSRAAFSNKEKVINLVSPFPPGLQPEWCQHTQGPRGVGLRDQVSDQLGERLRFLWHSHVVRTCGAVITENGPSC